MLKPNNQDRLGQLRKIGIYLHAIITTKCLPVITLVAFLLIQFLFIDTKLNAQLSQMYPFSTDSTHLTIWNDTEYVPFFIKGVNLGISKPGTFPGELAATKEDYTLWFGQIKEAGFNCIRLYTLHFPRFYEALEEYNRMNNQNPLLFIQGIWLEEEIDGYQDDLHFLSESFKQEIAENLNVIHGNTILEQRVGKAYGEYSTDVSMWCLAYLIGREIHPVEVLTTNSNNPEITRFAGNHFSIDKGSASEVWATTMLDYTLQYEQLNYQTQRPISLSSWPTLDPLIHPEETGGEDIAEIDLSKIDQIDAPAGLFISYHAYPYYPDFISHQSSYQAYSDNYGPNSYIGYLEELKSHYADLPLIIAEYGVPSSWVIAHYSTSGMNHGGFDEYNQGLTNIRILQNIRDTDCGGGIQFAWIDEWFKRTWIMDPIDSEPESRILWHNIASAEQNFGLLKFETPTLKDTLIKFNEASRIQYITAQGGYTFYDVEIGLKDPLDLPDELWLTFDTYHEKVGESQLPSGDTIPTRSEFALKITNYSSELYVTEAYDIFGIWHNVSDPKQLYRSTVTDGAPWEILRIRNNFPHSEVQYIGNLQVNYDFQSPSSRDAVVISDKTIRLRLPWSFLNVVEPNRLKVLNDYKNTPVREDTISDGFAMAIHYKNEWFTHPDRHLWEGWTRPDSSVSVGKLKVSYHVMRDQLTDFNTPAIAVRDSFYFLGPDFPMEVNTQEGLLTNDFDIDGDIMVSLITENPVNGQVYLNNDGSFSYQPNPDFRGYDYFKYTVYDGFALSTPNEVVIFIDENVTSLISLTENVIKIYPVPSKDFIKLESPSTVQSIQVFDYSGKLIDKKTVNARTYSLNISDYREGQYILVSQINNKMFSDRFIKN